MYNHGKKYKKLFLVHQRTKVPNNLKVIGRVLLQIKVLIDSAAAILNILNNNNNKLSSTFFKTPIMA